MPRSFAVRGVVEGFYGTPWTHAARLDVISFLAPRGMNAYVYAPKDDPRHRGAWREPYGAVQLEQFRGLAAHARAHGVRFGWAISPGLDIDDESESDRSSLLAKLAPLRDAGVDWFLLLLDDIPMQPGCAHRQAALASFVHAHTGGAALTVCPTEYVGTRPSPYLTELSGGLPDDVDLMWTGPTVCSPEIRADDARGWASAVDNHRVVVWDNYPVNDALMANALHLGPYRGRDAGLAEIVGGVLCNPMTQPHASLVALATAMDFLGAPDAYDPHASWARAIDDVGGAHRASLAVLARACSDGPLARPDSIALAADVHCLEDELDGPGWPDAVGALAAELRAARALPDAIACAGELGAEVARWAQAARTHANAGLAALRLCQQVRPVATVRDGVGRVAAPDPEAALRHAFAVLFTWRAARTDEAVVYGPRFALYTPVIQLDDGSPGLDAAAAVREDANAIDALCRLALRTYDDWRARASGEPVRVFVDGEARALRDDGTFDAQGSMILVRQGPLATRIDPAAPLPFSDARVA